MRRARITYKGAYHHIMSRGLKGENIFSSKRTRDDFLRILFDKTQRTKMRLFAYCIMKNHYHMILQNSTGQMSNFMKQLNGQYGMYYRKRYGGRGYVFAHRFKSTLIQNDNYLKVAIAYVILNPVRGGIVSEPFAYNWSSIHEYYSGNCSRIIDNVFVENLYGSIEDMTDFIMTYTGKNIKTIDTRAGKIIGDKRFVKRAMSKFERRKTRKYSKRKRLDDYVFEPLEEIIGRFEHDKGIKISGIDVTTSTGKELRAELLILFKDRAGLKYSQIIDHPLFKPLKYTSLSTIYKRYRKKFMTRWIN
ncbi:MAG: transposase [bacterium]